jgi:type VI secretion system Hcp family effector
MRFFTSTFAASTLLVLAGCSGAPGDSGDGNVATEQSPLEATGQVQFYATVKGVHTGTFPGESTSKKHLGQIPAFRFFWDGTAPTDEGTGAATGKLTQTPIQITKAFGASDPDFISALADHETLTVTLDFVNPDGTVFETIVLSEATVSDLQRATIALGDPNDTSIFADQISFSYQKMVVTAEPSGSTASINAGTAAIP